MEPTNRIITSVARNSGKALVPGQPQTEDAHPLYKAKTLTEPDGSGHSLKNRMGNNWRSKVEEACVEVTRDRKTALLLAKFMCCEWITESEKTEIEQITRRNLKWAHDRVMGALSLWRA